MSIVRNSIEIATALRTLADLIYSIPVPHEPLTVAPPPLASTMTLVDLERAHITNVLSQARTQQEAADVLGINLSTLWRKRRQYRLE